MRTSNDTFAMQSILVHWHDIQRLMHKHMETSARSSKKSVQELTFLQLRTLFYIQHNAPVNTRSLSEWLGTKASSTSILVDRLVETKWLQRVADEKDRRVTFLQLTRSAEKQLEQIMKARTERMMRVLRTFSSADLKELDRVLQKFQHALLTE